MYCDSVENDYGDTWSQPDNRASNKVTLGAGDGKQVTVLAITSLDQTLGNDYTLTYHIRYSDSGTEYRTPDYHYTATVIGPNEDVVVTAVNPTEFAQGQEGQLSLSLENKGSCQYKDVFVFCYSIVKIDDYSETWDEPENRSSNKIELLAGGGGQVAVDAITGNDQTTGEYTLTYDLTFRDEAGRKFQTPTYEFESIIVVE